MLQSFLTFVLFNRAGLRSGLIALSLLILAESVSVAQPRVYRDRVEPHWIGDQSRFWYRNDLANDTREFVLVDANAGTRAAAFDQAAVAAQLTEVLGRAVSANQLPIDSIEFTDDPASLTLIGRDGRFRWDAAGGKLSRIEATPNESVTELFLPIRPSENSSQETEIIVINQLDQPVSLIWIDPTLEQRSYGTVMPGETRQQHTYAGHVWLVRKSDGSDIGCMQAEENASTVTLNQQTLDSVRTEEPRRRRKRGEREASPENPKSPDGAWSVAVRDHNLWLKKESDTSERALSSDATSAMTFRKDASRSRSINMEFDRHDFPEHIADAVWSPDSKYIVAMQTTKIEERLVHYIESTPADQLQPKLRSYPYLKAGDRIPVSTPRLFRVADGQEIPIAGDLFPNPWSLEFQRWSDDGTCFWLLYNERGHQKLRLLEVTANTGVVRTIVDESSDTFIHYSSDGKFELRWLKDNQLLWASERSGWNHLYRYDLLSGMVINAVTSGDWNVRRIERIDEESGTLWFDAVGIRTDQDPYHEHFCRVRLDGSDFKVLTEGDGTHSIEWSPDRRWFIDRFSRVDLPPVTELRTADGCLVCLLESADASEIIQDRGALPERFVAKGRDGVTDIWGIVHLPKNFDPATSYPIVENIYAGPHDHHVPKAFQPRFGHQHEIADRGFIVVQIDGMGTAWRSRAFHDVCYQNLRDAGFPDRIAWMKALKDKIPQINLSRVGIYGGSAGGQNAMAALLWHGDFYKVAVADCGCHDNRMDKIWWNEQWMGLPTGDHYRNNSNMENAHLLNGQLMLVVGELDRNVDPATTTQVAKKLIDAGKQFDFVVVPGAGHGACETPWASRRRIEFLAEHLMAD